MNITANRDHFVKWRLGVFLLLCLVFGGTSQYILSVKLPLYIISLILISSTLTSSDRAPVFKLCKTPELLGALLILLYFVYLIPLPPGIWISLAGRELVVEGFKGIESETPWLPLSLTPEITLFSTFDFLPLIAISLIFRLQASKTEKTNTLFVFVFMGVMSVVLGAFQLVGGEAFYIYKITNSELPVGLFSNANHQACFLAMTLPLALVMGFKPRVFQIADTTYALRVKVFGASSAFIIIIGILLTNSLAGYVFLFVIIPPGLYITLGRGAWSGYILPVTSIFVLGLLLDFTIYGGHTSELLNKVSNTSPYSRSGIFSNTIEAQRGYGPFGTGPGSFFDIYNIHEDRAKMTGTFAPQAHNDYLQIALEFGVFGVLAVLGAIIWLLSSLRILISWKGRRKPLIAMAFLSLACPLIHSAADYPMRTIAISAIFYFLLLIVHDELNFSEFHRG